MKGPDEGGHFARAYQISRFQFVSPQKNGLSGGLVPRGLDDLEHSIRWISFDGTSFNELWNDRKIRFDPKISVFKSFPNIAVYPPLPFIPQAIGIRLAQTCTSSALFILYAARAANLLTYVAFVCAAMWLNSNTNTRVGLALIAMMPMSLYQAASLSADAMTISAALVFTAVLLKILSSQEEASNADLCFLLAFSIILSLTKLAYAPMLLAIFLIPIRKLGGLRKYALVTFLIVISTIFLLAFWMSRIGWHPRIIAHGDVDAQTQMFFLANHFSAVPSILITTVRGQWIQLINGLVGTFGFYEYPLPFIVVNIYLAMLAVVFWNGAMEYRKRNLIAVISIFTVVALAILTLDYLEWTEVGGKFVSGLQGRYFIPLLPLFLIADPAKNWSSPKRNRTAFVVAFLISAYSVVFLAQLLYLDFPDSRVFWRFSGT